MLPVIASEATQISSFRDGALAPDPESRDSGLDASHRPGMTKREIHRAFARSITAIRSISMTPEVMDFRSPEI
jgi:hypothetical protein